MATRRKLFSVLVISIFLAMTIIGAAAASSGPPVGGCPPTPKWELHEFMDHTDPDHDHHVGLEVDLNDDGWICVYHNRSGAHVHMDNVLPLE